MLSSEAAFRRSREQGSETPLIEPGYTRSDGRVNFRRCRRAITGLLATCLLAGCTATFTYNHLDWLIPWYVDDYVDLTRDQRNLLRGQLEPLLQWHREEELARYIEILDRIETDLAAPVTADTVRSWIDEVLDAGERVENSMLNLALEFSTTLSDEQMREFTVKMWEQQEEYEEDFLPRSDGEYQEENAENLEDFLHRFIGRLSPGQKQRLQQAARSMQRFDAIWLSEREAWLKTLEPLLQRPEGWQEAVMAAHANRTGSRPPQYREIFEYNLDVVTRAVADVLNEMNEKQQERVIKEIDSLRARMKKLISQ